MQNPICHVADDRVVGDHGRGRAQLPVNLLYGLQDQDALVSPCAYVVLIPGISPSAELAGEIQQFVKERIAAYKYPRHIRFIDRIPKTAGGKTQRFVLQERINRETRDAQGQ